MNKDQLSFSKATNSVPISAEGLNFTPIFLVYRTTTAKMNTKTAKQSKMDILLRMKMSMMQKTKAKDEMK